MGDIVEFIHDLLDIKSGNLFFIQMMIQLMFQN